ncbi:MAG: GlcG/HbpS family heme-binding protein [Myxococcota bacterium]
MSRTFSKQSLSSGAAQELLTACVAAAEAQGLALVFHVVDESGILKAYLRMDGAPLIAVDAARKKAMTAVGYGLPTGKTWHDFASPDPILSRGVDSFKDFTMLGGGLPLTVDGTLVGALGVSGAHYSQDEAVGQTAIAAAGLGS